MRGYCERMETPTTDDAKRAARKINRSPIYRRSVRAGLVAYGVMHLLIAFLTVRLATGGRDEEASQTGALRALAQTPLGEPLLWAMAAGFLVLVVWQVVTVLIGQREFSGAKLWVKRGSALGRIGVYIALGASAANIALGQDTGGEGAASDAGNSLMALPFGLFLVAGIGVAVGTVGVMLAIKAFTDSWEEDIRGTLGPVGTWLARIGNFTKGLSFLGVAALFIWAAVAYDPDSTGGLDSALQTVNQTQFGPWVLAAAAFGFACYGLYCFWWARRAKV